MTTLPARLVVIGLVCGCLVLGSAVQSNAAGPQFGVPGMPAPPAGGGGFGAPGQMQPRMSRQAAGRSGGAPVQQSTSPYRSRSSGMYSAANIKGQFSGGQVQRNSQSVVNQAKAVNRGR